MVDNPTIQKLVEQSHCEEDNFLPRNPKSQGMYGKGRKPAIPYEALEKLRKEHQDAQIARIARNAEYDQFDICGIVQNGVLRIRKRSEDAPATSMGRNCTTFKKLDLIEILWRFQIMPPGSQTTDSEDGISRDELIQWLSYYDNKNKFLKFSDDQLLFYYEWDLFNRSQMRDALKTHLEKIGRLFII